MQRECSGHACSMPGPHPLSPCTKPAPVVHACFNHRAGQRPGQQRGRGGGRGRGQGRAVPPAGPCAGPHAHRAPAAQQLNRPAVPHHVGGVGVGRVLHHRVVAGQGPAHVRLPADPDPGARRGRGAFVSDPAARCSTRPARPPRALLPAPGPRHACAASPRGTCHLPAPPHPTSITPPHTHTPLPRNPRACSSCLSSPTRSA